MTGGEIRPADAAALPALAGLCVPLLGPEWDGDSLAKLLESPGAFAWLAWPERPSGQPPGAVEPLGFALARAAGGDCELLGVGVTAPWRRQGLARSLLAACFAQGRLLGASRCTLEVAEDNAQALACYRALGFRQIGRRVNYYVRAGGAMAALVMASALSPNDATVFKCNTIISHRMR